MAPEPKAPKAGSVTVYPVRFFVEFEDVEGECRYIPLNSEIALALRERLDEVLETCVVNA